MSVVINHFGVGRQHSHGEARQVWCHFCGNSLAVTPGDVIVTEHPPGQSGQENRHVFQCSCGSDVRVSVTAFPPGWA